MLQYKTIRSSFEISFTEKKSEFIGQIAPISNELDAEQFAQIIRKKHHNASHNVPAFILRENGLMRCSDDGEPQGTAGVPVLEVLKQEQLVDVALVVTRYFGGTLLGTGGLVRAYSHAASLAVQNAPLLIFTECMKLKLSMEYTYYGNVMNVLSKQKHILENSDFGEKVTLELLVPLNDSLSFQKSLIELSSAQIEMIEKGTTFAEVV